MMKRKKNGGFRRNKRKKKRKMEMKVHKRIRKES